MEYIQNSHKEPGCIFCSRASQPDSPQNLIVQRGQRAFVILNLYPYTSGHLMVAPYAHQPSLEMLDADTRAEMMELVNQAIHVLKAVYQPQGINLGANLGEAAGAGITDHVHLHIVPRWVGDTNFMSAVGGTRVLPEAIAETWRRVRQGWEDVKSKK
jgi:ATP adenylyltransferase